MLIRLALQNIAIIESLELEFRPGLNAITGETGAGKSLILDAIQRVFARRTSPRDLLRRDTSRGHVELVFDLAHVHNRQQIESLLQETGVELLPEENELILGRDLTANTSRCRVNGCQVPAETMEKLGTLLIEIYGQHDLHTLFSTARQRDLLDNMGGEPLQNLRREIRKAFRKLQELRIELESLRIQQETRERQLDFLTFQVQEIAQAEISDPNEDENLKVERERLSHCEKLRLSAMQAQQILSYDDSETPSVLKLLQQVSKTLNAGTGIDPQFAQWYESITAVQEDLRLLAQQLDHYSDRLDSRPERMQEIVNRLDVLEKLKRKYGGTLENTLRTAAELEAELDALQQAEVHFADLKTQLREVENRYSELCRALTDMRHAHALALESAIQSEMQALMLPAAKFSIQIEPVTPSETGQDQVTFLFSANPGEPLKPLSQVASGGELARLMLALKIRTAHADSLATLILDEIDIGMSGTTLRAVSEKLHGLQQSCQVIVITHQPIVAAKAGWHLHVQKHLLEDGVTVSAMPLVKLDQRKMVLSQLASGFTQNDEATMQFIEQLLV